MKEVVFCGALVLALATPALADVCSNDPFAAYDDLSGTWSPCATPRGSLVTESAYIQNASAVGGTNYAAYPMIDLRTGVFPRIEFAFHTPSQIAESGPRGIGLYPSTHLGYGLRYEAFDSSRLTVAVASDVLPPVSRFSPNNAQSRYVFGVTSLYEVTQRVSLGIASSGTSSGTVGFQRVLPSAALRAGYIFGSSTELSSDVGSRFPARTSGPQSYSDVAVDQLLTGKLFLKAGAGTTFNEAMGSKAHYLAAGFNYRP